MRSDVTSKAFRKPRQPVIREIASSENCGRSASGWSSLLFNRHSDNAPEDYAISALQQMSACMHLSNVAQGENRNTVVNSPGDISKAGQDRLASLDGNALSQFFNRCIGS